MDPVAQTRAHYCRVRTQTLSVTNAPQRRCRKYRQEPSLGMKLTRGIKEELGKKKQQKCGETERDTGRSVEALVAQLPRMLSDSGRLMTGSRGRSESERAGAALQTGAPLSLGPSMQATQPAPPAVTGGAASCPINPGCWILFPEPSQSLIIFINMKTNGKISTENHTQQGAKLSPMRHRGLGGTSSSTGCQNVSTVMF